MGSGVGARPIKVSAPRVARDAVRFANNGRTGSVTSSVPSGERQAFGIEDHCYLKLKDFTFLIPDLGKVAKITH